MLARHDSHIRRALKVAATSGCRWTMGSVIARGNRVISFAPNSSRNAPQIDWRNATVHTEVAAIKGS